ncbi:hypothetical protein J5X84_12520 [Streptosporangiaceae bacterium NEAU-GS5]|nr:hypothetical protein [Streptosporangiaceae bacterium NEAU-GS5]
MSEWRVLVEENLGQGSGKSWHISEIYEVEGGQPEARSIAYELAMRHVPQHPTLGGGERAVYRINEDMWLTMIQGTVRRYHFRVTVAELFHKNS